MGPYEIVVMIIVMLVLLYLASWFAGSETAITNLNLSQLARIEKRGTKRSKYVMELKKNMDKSLITILVANNIVNIVLSSIAALFANVLFETIGVSIMIGLITFLIIAFGEIVPKSNAIRNSEKVTLSHSFWLYYLSKILTPLIMIFVLISKFFTRMRGGKAEYGKILVSDQDIKDLVSLGEGEGIIKSIEREMIDHIFKFGDGKLSEIMVPMEKVFFFDNDMDVKIIKKMVSSRGFTRIPFIGEKGEVKGLVYSKDLLGREKGMISKLIRPTIFLSDDTDVTKAFKILKDRRIHMAIVIDKNGAHIGIVTLEDILEEIVGDIYDEFFIEKNGAISKEVRPISST